MNEKLLLSYQRKLIYACLDDFSGISAMGDYAGGQDGPSPRLWWQASVDFLYRNLVSGLIEPNPIHAGFPTDNPLELCQLFAKNKPDDASFWFYVHFDATYELTAVAQKHGLLDWAHFHAPLNIDFMQEIEGIYVTKGVSLSHNVLISIHAEE